LEGC